MTGKVFSTVLICSLILLPTFATASFKSSHRNINIKASVLNNIACQANACIAVGLVTSINSDQAAALIDVSNDNGKRWHQSSQLPVVTNQVFSALYDIASSNKLWVAVGEGAADALSGYPIIYASQDAGKTWFDASPTFDQNSNQASLNGVSCENNSCVTVGNFNNAPMIYYSLDGGFSWLKSLVTFHNSKKEVLNSVTCENKQCIAIGGYANNQEYPTYLPIAFRSDDGGVSWSSPIFLPTTKAQGNVDLMKIACHSNVCVAVGNYNNISDYAEEVPVSYTSHDNGITWDQPVTLQVLQDQGGELNGISCEQQHCVAVGFNSPIAEWSLYTYPVTYFSEDSGATWSAPKQLNMLFTNIAGFQGVTCNGENCLAVGGRFLFPLLTISSDGGNSWKSAL